MEVKPYLTSPMLFSITCVYTYFFVRFQLAVHSLKLYDGIRH